LAPGSRIVALLVAMATPLAMASPGTQGSRNRVQASRLTYHGWRDAIRLRNRHCELVIVPSVGRIMRFASPGGANLLWENSELRGKAPSDPGRRKEWLNYGGDKLWPAPQERWGWPPDPYLDGSPWAARIAQDGSVSLTSRVSPLTGLRFRRRIALRPDEAVADLVNTLTNAGAKPVEWGVWEIAQVDDPDSAGMARGRGRGFDDGYRAFPDGAPPADALIVLPDRIEARRSPARSYKIGANPSKGRLWAVKDGWKLAIAVPTKEPGSYPDGGCNVEIYSNPDPLRYMELECLGPVRRIGPGKETTLRTSWTLSRVVMP